MSQAYPQRKTETSLRTAGQSPALEQFAQIPMLAHIDP